MTAPLNPDCVTGQRSHRSHALAGPGGNKPGAACGGWSDPEKVLAWFVAWRCGCAQTTTNAIANDVLPQRCPGHDTERIARPEQLDVLSEHATTHLCGETVQPCQDVAA